VKFVPITFTATNAWAYTRRNSMPKGIVSPFRADDDLFITRSTLAIL